MADVHDCRAVVTFGGTQLSLCATKWCEQIYASRFSHDIAALGHSEVYEERKLTKEEREALGTEDTVTRAEVQYTGHIKRDLRITLYYPFNETEELPLQALAAIWAMARADRESDFTMSWEEFKTWYMCQPSSVAEDVAAWGAVCDLAIRAFFRTRGGQDGPAEPDEAQEGQGGE